MNFDNALKHYWPRGWYRLRFFKHRYRGRGEPELRLIRHLVAPGSIALDVGCSVGMYTAEMARYAAKVIAFEANPAVAAFTARVVPRNVEVVNVALSSERGTARLVVPRNPNGKSISELGTIDADNPAHGVAADQVDVAMKRLDDFAIRDCSFIKIDVEGHEEAVLDGTSQLIAQRPILLAELDEGIKPGTVQRFAERCTEMSYQGYFLSRGRLQPITAFDPALHQDQSLLRYARKALPPDREYINNFVFVPAERATQLLARLE